MAIEHLATARASGPSGAPLATVAVAKMAPAGTTRRHWWGGWSWRWLWAWPFPLAVLALWQLSAVNGWVPDQVLPPPGVVFSTFADLAGVRMPEGKDAVSYKNMLLGKPGKLRDYIVIDHTIITGDGWKLTMKNGQWLLFQISRDPEERNNLAEKQPKQLERLQAIYKKEAGSPRKDR